MKKTLETKKTHLVERNEGAGRVTGMRMDMLKEKYNVTEDEIINLVWIILFLTATIIVVVW